jgi:hypothetical protein
VTFRYCCGPAFAGIDNLNASPVPPEINRSKKAGGPAAYDKTIQHVALNPLMQAIMDDTFKTVLRGRLGHPQR